MPLIKVQTSVAPSAEQRQTLVGSLSKILAETIGKPEQYVMAVVEEGELLMSGQPGPAAFADVRSIGGLRPEVNRHLAQRICQLLETALGIPAERVYLNFSDVPAENWGWRGTTFG